MGMDELRAALEQNPNDTRTFQSFLEPLLKEGDEGGFEEFLSTVLDAVTDDESLANLMRAADFKAKSVGGDIATVVTYRIGRVFLDRIGNEDMAEMYFRRLPGDSPFALELHDFYVDFYMRKENWRKLEQLFQREAEMTGEANPAVEAKRKVARLARDRGNADRALAYWQSLRKEIPNDPEVQQELIELYEETGKWHQVADILKARADGLPDSEMDEKIELYHRLIPIYQERLKMDAKVAATYQSILALRPADESAFQALCDHYRQTDRWPDLVKVLKARIDSSDDAAQSFALYREVAEIMEEKFSNTTEAMKNYEAMLEIAPDDLEVIRKLKELYEQRRDFTRYVEVASRELEFLEGDERFAQLRELARLSLENVRDPEIGIGLWRDVREQDPTDSEAFDALMHLYERSKQYEGVAGLLEERIEQVDDAQEQQQLLERLATLYATRIGDVDAAASAWKRLLALDGENHRARAELKKILVRAKDLETLDWFFRNYGALNDYQRTLDMMAKDEEEDILKAQILFRVASLYLEGDGVRPDRARTALEQVLEVDPANIDAAQQLVPLYQQLEKWEELVQVQDLLLMENSAMESEERLDLLLSKAQVHEEKLSQVEEAFFTYVQAYQLDWTRSDVHRELERLAEASGNWESYISVLEQTLELVDEDVYKVPYLQRIAEIWEHKLDDIEAASEYYNRVLAIDDTNLAALGALGRLHRRTGQWEPLRDVLGKRLAIEHAPAERQALLLELGEVCQEFIGDADGAVSAYQSLIQEFPDLALAYDRLADVLLREKRNNELLETLEARLAALQPQGPELADSLVDIGMLYFSVHGDVGLAVERYIESLHIEPEGPRAVPLLEELLGNSEVQYRIARALEPVYEARESLMQLADVLEIQAQHVEEHEQATLFARLKDIYLQLDNDVAASYAVRRLLRLTPEDNELRQQLEAIAERLDNWFPVVELYNDIVGEIQDMDYRHEVMRANAAIYHLHLGDRDLAKELYRAVLEEAPGDAQCLAALQGIAFEEEDWAGLLAIYETRKDLEEDPEGRIAVMFEIARLCKEHLDDLERASTTVEEVIDLDPTNVEALRLLDELYTGQERWEDLMRALEQTASLATDPDVRVELLLRMAQLNERRLGDPQGMVDKLEQVLSLDDRNEAAVEILERNIEGDVALPVLDLLQGYMQRVENWERFIDLLYLRKSFVEDPLDQLLIQKEIARVYEEELNNLQSAFENYRIALALNPEDEDVLTHLLLLAESLGNFEELFVVLDDESKHMDEGPQQVQMWRIQATMARDRLNDSRTAIEYFRRVMEREPEDLDSVEALADLYRAAEQWEELVGVLDVLAELVSDLDRRKELYLEMGSVYHSWLEQPDNAIRAYEELLGLAPEDITALANLENLYTETSRWDELEQILQRRAQVAADDDERRALLLSRAEVLETHLDRLDEANQVLLDLFGQNREDMEVVERLEVLHEKREDWLSLLELLQHKLTLTPDDAHYPILMKIARTHATQLFDVHEAVATWQRVLEQFPYESGPIDELEQLVLEGEEKEAAFDLLKPILVEQAQWERLLVNMTAFKDSLDLPERRLDLLLEMAGVAQERLDDLQRAFFLAAEALRVAPGRRDVQELLEGIGSRADLLEQVVEVYTGAAEEAESTDDAMQLMRRKAEVLKNVMQDFPRAVEEYEKLREFQPERYVLEALDELYSVLEDWDRLADVLRDEIEMSPEIDEKLAHHYRLADVAEEQLRDPQRACEVIKEALLLGPENETSLVRLRRLYDEQVSDPEAADLLESYYASHEQWEDVASILERRFALAQAREDKLEIAHKLITVFLSQIDDKAHGLQYAGEALVLDPEDYAARQQLLELKDATGQAEEAVNYLQLARFETDNTETFRTLGMEAGGLLRQLDRADEAETVYREVIERDEMFVGAWKALESLYEEQDRLQEHEQTLEMLVELEEFEDDKIPLLLKLGRLRRDRIDNMDGAMRAFSAVVAIDERNEEALNSLASLYEMNEMWQELSSILVNMVELTQDTDERIALLSRLAMIQEERLEDNAAAIQAWHDVLDWNPNADEVLANLERLYEIEGEWQSFVEMAEREALLDAVDEARKVELWRRIGQVADEHLEDTIVAQQNWVKVAEVRPDDEEAQRALRRLFRVNSDFLKLAGLLERLASDESRAQTQRVEFWKELGQVKMEEVMDPDGAILAWSEVLSLEPHDLESYAALERLYMESARFEEAVTLLQDKLALVSEDEGRVALLDKVATLQEESLNRWEEAATTRQAIIELQPGNLDQYERVAGLFESHEQWAPLAQLLEQRLGVEEDADARVETLTWLAEIDEQKLEDDNAAVGAIKRALAERPGDPEFIGMGERIGQRAELWNDLYDIWSGAVPHLDEEDRRVDTMLKLGRLLRDRLDNYNEAVSWFEQVVEADPDAEEALTALVELYEVVEQWEKLAETLDKLSQVTADFQKQIEYSLRLGDTWFHKLEDYARAQEAYRQVLELDPTEEKAVEALQTLYTEAGDWEKLIEILGVRASLHPEEDAELKLISGDLWENQLGDPMKAAELYDELITYDPGATEAFERLERIYTEREVWDRLVETYDKRLTVTVNEETRVEMLRKLALINETVIENGEAAADYYQQILDLRPEDLETINALEKLYEEQDRWDDLVLVLRRTVQLADTVRDKVAYLEKVAGIYADRLDDQHSAIMAYKEILEHDPGHLETLTRLESLFAGEGDWMEVLNVLDLRLKIAADVDEVVGYYIHKGNIYRDEMLMLDKAREQYHIALERIPDHKEATENLIALYEEEAQFEKVIETLLAQARAVDSEEQRARIFARMGHYMKEHMEDYDRAVEVFEAALDRVHNLPEALSPLAEIYMQREQWEKAFPLLEMLKQAVEEASSSAEQADLYRKLARASLSVGKKEEALEYYRRAYDRNPEDLVTLEGLARLNLEEGNHEVAEAYFRSLLEKGEGTFDADKIVEIYRALGEVEMHLGRPEKAREHLARVLEMQPNDRGCLNDLVQLMEYHSDWDGAIRYRRQLADLLDDSLEKWKMYIAIGDIYREKLDNLELAIRAYNDALAAQPYSKSALVKLLEIHINARAFAEAINILQHLVQVEDNPQKKASYTFTIATIYRQELEEPDMAVDYYEQTVDLHPEKLEAFRAVDEILTEQRNWQELEGAYSRMAQRIRGKGMEKVEFTLYRGLGEIYRSRLREPEKAAASYEMAARLRPDDKKVREILAQLHEYQGQKDKAIEQYRYLSYLEPERIETYRSLANLLREVGQEDDAWFSLAVLAMGGKLSDEERTFYKSKQSTGLVTTGRSIDHSLWTRTVFSRAENIHVGEIFQTIYQAIGDYLEGRDPKELGLRRKDELDMRQRTVFTTVFNRVSSMLGVPTPRVYLSERSFGMRIEATIPPVLVIGKDMLHGKSEKELAFIIAKNLTYFHPMHVLAACYPAPVLKLLYQVALKFVHPDVAVDGSDSEQFQVLSQHLRKRISPQLATTLSKNVDHFYRRNLRPGINKWLTGVELTANHAGLLACLDLPVAANVLKQESIAFSKLPPREKAKELVFYAVSEEFSTAREALGLRLP